MMTQNKCDIRVMLMLISLMSEQAESTWVCVPWTVLGAVNWNAHFHSFLHSKDILSFYFIVVYSGYFHLNSTASLTVLSTDILLCPPNLPLASFYAMFQSFPMLFCGKNGRDSGETVAVPSCTKNMGFMNLQIVGN